jgi:hypothetical protein
MLKTISNPMRHTRHEGSPVFASPVLRGSRPEVSP